MRMAPVLSRTDFASQPRKGKAISTYNSLRWGPPKSLMWQATGKFRGGRWTPARMTSMCLNLGAVANAARRAVRSFVWRCPR
ncbi:Uncharacterised protein [Mycobacteroides abscessus subsp. massiliense]|nr:Uncharacterised protein [Mycobacteroides abscessus subsp. massiliense]SLJ50517.1 Uncharacterised protein [Mycobacteroides abscessus subsp. abscessus]